jgi:hypothetical protein
MPNAIVTAVKNLSSIPSFELANLAGFPYSTYTAQNELYEELERWYTGQKVIDEVVDKATGKAVERYPIRINPLKGTTSKHTSVLFGRSIDSMRHGGIPVKFMCELGSVTDEQAKAIEVALNDVWAENGGGSLFVTNGLLSQYLGGCVFAASWLPEQKRILITNPKPNEFIGIPDGIDYVHLREAWIVRKIDSEDLPAYGMKAESNTGHYYYIEHWDRKTYKISINDVPLMVGDNPAEGANVFGTVPIQYIPHIRVKGLLGDSIISDAAKGIIKEINLRWADTGDAVSDDSHTAIAIRNVRSGAVKVVKLPDGRIVYDLGSSTGLTNNEANPDMITVSSGSASEPMLKFGSDLYAMYRREVDHPAVADGEDEGSQRSGATLYNRMWSLTAHAELERVFWSVGLSEFSKILLKMMAVKEQYGITTEHTKAKFVIGWSPMLPHDRETLIQEMDIRARNKISSREHLMELSGDIIDTDKELAQIRAEKDLDKPISPLAGGNTQGGKDGGQSNSRGSQKA